MLTGLTTESGSLRNEAAIDCLRAVSDEMVSAERRHMTFNLHIQIQDRQQNFIFYLQIWDRQ